MSEKDLLRQWLGNKEYLSVFDVPKLDAFGEETYHNTALLYEIYEKLMSEDEMSGGMQSGEAKYGIRGNDDGTRTLSIDGREINLPFDEMKELIQGLSDIGEDTLPLGSTVELDKDFMSRNIPAVASVPSIRVIITHRFLSYTDKVYYPYAGVLYPIGMLGRTEVLHFSAPMIKEVIHRGYSDEAEDEYVYMMKKELILERDMHSAGFATREELEEIEKLIKGGQDE